LPQGHRQLFVIELPVYRREIAKIAEQSQPQDLHGVSRKSALAGAIGYALKLWPALTRYRDDGRIEIDNNAAERALRSVRRMASYFSSSCSKVARSIPSLYVRTFSAKRNMSSI
jgi:hypothetical protein